MTIAGRCVYEELAPVQESARREETGKVTTTYIVFQWEINRSRVIGAYEDCLESKRHCDNPSLNHLQICSFCSGTQAYTHCATYGGLTCPTLYHRLGNVHGNNFTSKIFSIMCEISDCNTNVRIADFSLIKIFKFWSDWQNLKQQKFLYLWLVYLATILQER